MATPVGSTPHPRRSAWFLVAVCAGAIGYLTLSPASGEPGTTFFCLICGSRGGVDAVLNVCLFAPLGFALVLCGVRPARAIVLMFVVSACIEATQFFAIAGRDATFGDITTNTIGGSIGVAISYWRLTLLRPSPRLARYLCIASGAVWLAIQLVVSFAFAPSLPATRYYGQIARSFAAMAAFPGAVLDARIGATPIPDVAIPDSAGVRALLLRNAPLSAVVVPGPATPRLAPIVRIADSRREEIVMLGQDGRAAIFGVRAGASELRLRPPLFRLPNAFPAASHAARDSGTVRLFVRYGRAVRLQAEREQASPARDIAVTVGLGWTLILPGQWYIEGTAGESILTGLWLLASVTPLGFWIGWMRSFTRRARAVRARAAVTLILAALFTVGLDAVPQRAGLAPEGLFHLLAAAAGIVAGLLLSRLMAQRPANSLM